MRVLRLHTIRDLRMHDEPVPDPGPGEVRIAVKSVGICASDVHYYRDGGIGTTRIIDPIVLGHEGSGVIDAVGEGVTGLIPGDRVAIEPAKPCMECEWCRAGHYNVCPGIPFFGTPPTDGCLRDYVVWPARLALKIPNSLSFDDAAMTEPLSVGIYAMQLGGPKPDDVIAILGAGAIGLSVLIAAKNAGVGRVIVSEPVRERRAAALKLGASEVIDPGAVHIEDAVNTLTGGRGADMVFECTGEEDAVRESCRIARIMGKLVIVGIPTGDDYPFDASTARRKQLRAVFVRRTNQTTETAIEWAAEGKADLSIFATHHFPLERTADAMELASAKADGVIRAIVVVGD